MTHTAKVVRGDVVRTAGGGVTRVEGYDKLRQGLRALLALDAPEGVGILALARPSADDSLAVSALLRRRLRERLEEYQAQLASTQVGQRDPRERISAITRTTAAVDLSQDPTRIDFAVAVTSGDRSTPVTLSGARVFP